MSSPVPSPPLISANAAGRALHLSPRTVALLDDHPQTRQFAGWVWDKLAELERTGQFPGAIDALRRVLGQARFIDPDVTWQEVAWTAVSGVCAP